ncbi:mRNA interferase [Elstera cyanobacteriorum]|uniref:Pemk protein n=1 Tax=Elstera cyanobacteriorum TaxID=2022747 RepID=A0A255XIS2_9PROT|nr:type II toxin-antitoxin system PemK/MazF family toxin [Elstera cyanobacteriorum]OYQ16857.1 pemk protein [Elstera cyanobacteriorum]GFZ89066.1 mRNA interferase [Elstera cyanobacteriorum]
MKQGDIYLVPLDPTAGHEQSGSRPVLIVSRTAFNHATKLPVVMPITSGGQFARKIGFAVELKGTKTTGIVRSDQPRVIDLDARQAQFIEAVPPSILQDVLAKLMPIFI